MSLTTVARADTRRLPLRDRSVDLIVTSPPYFALRDYGYPGQIGIEPTPADFLEALWAVTAEWIRVLKPEGSLFVNLGDKYSQYEGARRGHGRDLGRPERQGRGEPLAMPVRAPELWGVPAKSLMGLPWRYAIGCMDRLGLILRAEIIWSKPNGLPESVTDRARRSHEQMFHFVKQPRYYSAVDDIREQTGREADPVKYARLLGTSWHDHSSDAMKGMHITPDKRAGAVNPLGKLPGSVWSIPSAPLMLPERLGVDHFAAFPPALVRPIVAGWSPPAICTACGEGRRPVAASWRTSSDRLRPAYGGGHHGTGHSTLGPRGVAAVITGYVCACTPYTGHPGTRGDRPARQARSAALGNGVRDNPGGGYGNATRHGPWRHYHIDGWQPPPSVPGVVLDPFGGTGTTALVASVLGRRGITLDLSAGYCRAAQWRVHDPGERARALGVAKPPPVPDGQGELFGLM